MKRPSASLAIGLALTALILAAAGLIKGKRAACHWAWRDMLKDMGSIPDAARVVRDGNVFSGGGVTAGAGGMAGFSKARASMGSS